MSSIDSSEGQDEMSSPGDQLIESEFSRVLKDDFLDLIEFSRALFDLDSGLLVKLALKRNCPVVALPQYHEAMERLKELRKRAAVDFESHLPAFFRECFYSALAETQKRTFRPAF